MTLLTRFVVGIAVCVGTLWLSAPLRAQSLADSMLTKATAAVQAALADDAQDATVVAAGRALRDLLDALGAAPERDLTQQTLTALRDHEGAPVLVANEAAQELFDELAKQRVHGHPERLLPALLLLESRDPQDPRVLFCLAQAYGVPSAVFDAKRAAAALEQLLEGLRNGGDAGGNPAAQFALMQGFLPELSSTKFLSKREQGECKVWLRRELLGLRDAMQKGLDIGRWPLADARLIALQDVLAEARRKLQQRRSHQVLTAMLAIQPDNPVLRLAFAEVCASHGPVEDRRVALRCLDAFLAAIDPDVLDNPAPDAGIMFSRSAIQRDLSRYRVMDSRVGVEEQRMLAEAMREQLADKKAPPLWLCPDRKEVDKRRRKIAPRVKRALGKRAKLEKSLRRNEANLERTRGIPANPGDKATRIREFRVQIARQKKRLARMDEELGSESDELKMLDALLAAAKKR